MTRVLLNTPKWAQADPNQYELLARAQMAEEARERLSELARELIDDVAQRNKTRSRAACAIVDWMSLNRWNRFWSSGRVLRNVLGILDGRS